MSHVITADDLMTREVVVAGFENKFSQIMEFFHRFQIAHLPVVHEGKLVGIFSLNDAMNLMYNRHLMGGDMSFGAIDKDFNLEQVMSQELVTVAPTASINEVAEKLSRGQFQCVPVLENETLKGIISNQDMVKAYSKELNPGINYKIETSGFGI